MNTIPQPTRLPGKLKSFLISNPWYGFAGILVGMCGILLSVYFFFAGQQDPDIRYAVFPGRAVLVQGGRPSDLSVLYKGTPLEGSVTSVFIEIWNHGKKAILPADILKSIQITADSHRILEAKLLRASREIANLQLNNDALADGIVGLQFRILEHNDAALVQLIYEGSPDVQITAQGIVIGQPAMVRVNYPELKVSKTADEYRWEKNKRLLVFGASLFVLAGCVVTLHLKRWKPSNRLSAIINPLIGIAIGLLLSGGIDIYRDWVSAPPIVFY